MKALALLLLFFSINSWGVSTIGDMAYMQSKATTGYISHDGSEVVIQQSILNIEREILRVDSLSYLIKETTTRRNDGRVWVETGSTDRNITLENNNLSDYCNKSGGELVLLTVVAGTFETCRIDTTSTHGSVVEGGGQTLRYVSYWLGKVPFSIIKAEASANDGEFFARSTTELFDLKMSNINE
jgi:hypothetical protein